MKQRVTDDKPRILVMKDQEEVALEKERDDLQAKLDAKEEGRRETIRKNNLRSEISELRRKLGDDG